MGFYRNLNKIQRRTTCNEHYLTIAAKIIKVKLGQVRATCTVPLIYITGNIRSKHTLKKTCSVNCFFRPAGKRICQDTLFKFNAKILIIYWEIVTATVKIKVHVVVLV